MTSAPTSGFPVKTTAIWVLRVLFGAAFLMAAYVKLSSNPQMVAEFDSVGLGQWFRHVTGLLELAGGIAILIPATSVIGAGILLCVDAGAFVAQVFVLHIDWIHCIVIGALLVTVIWLQTGNRAR